MKYVFALWKMQQIWDGNLWSTRFWPDSAPRLEQIDWNFANAMK